jgi:hypothetical protein
MYLQGANIFEHGYRKLSIKLGKVGPEKTKTKDKHLILQYF